MCLFAEAPKNAFAGMAVAFSEEDICLFVTGDELTSEELIDQLINKREGKLIAADLKPDLRFFPDVAKADSWDTCLAFRARCSDRTVAAHICSIRSRESIRTMILQRIIWD